MDYLDKILDLTQVHAPESNFCGYRIVKYPDGQQSVIIDEKDANEIIDIFKQNKISNFRILIRSRLNSFQDLEIIICATQALRDLGVKDIHLDIPYCIGGRSDRKFFTGDTNYIKNVISPIINSQKYTKVYILDPHSDVLEACIDNLVKIPNDIVIKFALESYVREGNDIKNVRLLSPDAGAMKKIYSAAKKINYEHEIILASKNRNQYGDITGTQVNINDSDLDKDIFIIDDICDGGRTFTEIAKVIKASQTLRMKSGSIYLIVSHGIFSYGFNELNKYFKKIYTTNSIKDKLYTDLVEQLDIYDATLN